MDAAVSVWAIECPFLQLVAHLSLGLVDFSIQLYICELKVLASRYVSKKSSSSTQK